MALSGDQLHALKDALAKLGTRLIELENRIDEGNDSAFRSLTEALNEFNVIERIVEAEDD